MLSGEGARADHADDHEGEDAKKADEADTVSEDGTGDDGESHDDAAQCCHQKIDPAHDHARLVAVADDVLEGDEDPDGRDEHGEPEDEREKGTADGDKVEENRIGKSPDLLRWWDDVSASIRASKRATDFRDFDDDCLDVGVVV